MVVANTIGGVVKYTGICGSDVSVALQMRGEMANGCTQVHYWTDGAIGDFVVKAPMVLGHESSGIVHSVGDKVTSVKPGDRVAMEPGIPCRRCARCKEGTPCRLINGYYRKLKVLIQCLGKYNLCPDMAFAATPPYDGTLAKYYALPEDFCYKLPEHVPLEHGAVVEPLSVAVHIVRQQANVEPGQTVAIWGAGPVGLLCMAVAKAFGASKIIAVRRANLPPLSTGHGL